MQSYLNIAIIAVFSYIASSVTSNNNYNKNETFFREKFEEYQVKFGKHYENKTEEEHGFNNFANNLVEINDLNSKLAKNVNNTKLYIVNKFADEDPVEIDDHYGYKLIPYDEVDIKEGLRSQLSESNDNNTRSIKDAHLYDLQEADQLYKEYQKQFNKSDAISKKQRTIRYYRFVKTLVEINKNNMEGKALRTLDDQADKIQKPLEYFY